MKKINSLLAAALLASAFVLSAAFFIGGCNETAPAKEEAKKEEAVTPATAAVAVTNPNFSIAPVEYAELSEKALGHFAKFEYDAWAEMLADNVTYVFPDGDLDTPY